MVIPFCKVNHCNTVINNINCIKGTIDTSPKRRDEDTKIKSRLPGISIRCIESEFKVLQHLWVFFIATDTTIQVTQVFTTGITNN